MLKDFILYKEKLEKLPDRKLLITTINAHSYNVAENDKLFEEALIMSDVLLPDGISVVWAARLLNPLMRTGKLKKIAGEELFYYEMKRLQTISSSSTSTSPKRAFFLGSTDEVLAKIKVRAAQDFPQVEIYSYSPPYKVEFSSEDNRAMLEAIHAADPDVLFVGMTAPKQEKWAYSVLGFHRRKESVGGTTLSHCHVCCIGAVFDFYAGTVKRAPRWVIRLGMEWFYRLIMQPRRMWRRYLIGNFKFVFAILKEFLK